MRTIRQNFEEAIGLLKTNLVVNHIKACELVYIDLSMIKDFPKEPMNVFIYYQKYLVEKHQSVRKVGLFEKILQWFLSRGTAKKLTQYLNACQASKFGDGDKLLQEMFMIIRKAI